MNLLSILFLIPFASSYVVPDQSQLSAFKSDSQKADNRAVAPGIGIQFTTSYATAAVRYHNGTIKNIVKVPAGSDYTDLVARRAPPGSSKTW